MMPLKRLFSPRLPRTLRAAFALSTPPIFGSIDTQKVLALVDKGVDHQWTDKRGWTLLMTAIGAMQPSVVQRLIETGADINRVVTKSGGWEGSAPLHVAVRKGNIFSLEHLLKAGANVEATDADGSTPLFLAATDADETALLMAYGADIHKPDKRGRTPLMRAAAHALSVKPVKQLLAAGAQIDTADEAGKIITDYADFNRYPECDGIQKLVGQAVAAQHAARVAEKRATVEAIGTAVQQTRRDITVFRRPLRFKR